MIKAKLGENNKAIHRSLLSAYRSPGKKHAWHTISDDGYLYDHLAYHLFEAGEREELKALFADQQWLRARVSRQPFTYDDYLTDLFFALESAFAQTRKQSEMDRDPESFAECLRYILIRTSINSIAGNYMPELIARAVETGAWTTDQAMDIVAKVPYPEQQIHAYLSLLETHLLSSIQQKKAQEEAAKQTLVLWDEEKKARLLVRLVPLHSTELVERAIAALEMMTNHMAYVQLAIALHSHVPGEKQTKILQKALSLNLSIIEEIGGKDLFLALAPLLPEELLVVALDALFKKTSFFFRPEMLTVLATRLSGNLMEQALERTLEIREPWECEECLRVFVPFLPESLLRQALEAALACENEWRSAHIIAPLAPKLRNGLLHQALEHTLTFSNEKACEWALAALLGWYQFAKEQLDVLHPMVLDLSRKKCLWPSVFFVRQEEFEHQSQMLQEILKTVLIETVQWERAALLNGLFPVLNEKQLEQVLEIIFKKEDSDMVRPSLLQKLVPYLSDDLLQNALNHVFLENSKTFVFMLSTLKPYLSEEQIEQVLQVALQLEEKEIRLQILKELAPCLNEESHQQTFLHMLELIFSVDKEGAHALARELVSLAPYLKGLALKKAWELVSGMKDDWTRKQIVTALIPQMAGELLAQMLQATLDMREEKAHLQTLIVLASRLEGEQRQYVLTYVLETTLAMTDSQERVPLLIQLIPHLDGSQRDQVVINALEGALALPQELARAQSLALLVPFLLEQDRDKAIAETWKNTQELGNEHLQVTILEILAPHLSGSYLEQAQTFTFGLRDKRTRHQLQITLAQRISIEERNKILTSLLAESLEEPDERVRLRLLTLLAPQLNEHQRFIALSNIRDSVQLINDEQTRIEVLVRVMSLFTAEQQQWALSIIIATSNEWLLTAALIQVASQLHAPVHEQAVQGVLMIKNEWFRAQALVAFLPLLPEQHSFLRWIREVEVNGLLSLQNSSRESILQHHVCNNMFISPHCSTRDLTRG